MKNYDGYKGDVYRVEFDQDSKMFVTRKISDGRTADEDEALTQPSKTRSSPAKKPTG